MSGDQLADVERVDQADAGDQLADGYLRCEACSTTFEHTKSGRKPKRCPDCRTSRSTSSTRAESAPKRPRSIEALERNLAQQLGLIGMGLMFVDQFDAQVVLSNAEEGARVLANLAATNDSIRRTLERSAELAGWGPVLLWAAKMSVPMMAHHGLIRGVPDPATVKPNGNGNGKPAGPFGPFDGVTL